LIGLVWIVLASLIGGVLGAFWYWLWSRAGQDRLRLALQQREQVIAELREALGQERERLVAEQQEKERMQRELQSTQIQLAGLRPKLEEWESLQRDYLALQTQSREQDRRLAEYQERLLQESRQAEEKQALLLAAQERLHQAFTVLSAEALRRNNEDFLRMAQEKLGQFLAQAQQDLENRQQGFGQMVDPVRESLQKMNERLDALEQVRTGAYSALSEQLRGLVQDHLPRLHRETAALVKALRQPAARGRWGEMQLRRVVEMAGMLDHCDFVEQASMQSEQGQQRPDLLVHLPGGKEIVVDAKAPLNAYLHAIEAESDEDRQQWLRKHAAELRTHLQQLGRKSYWEAVPSPEFVVLFLPGEDFFSAALQMDPGLIEFGVEQKVLVATPTTLIALLRAAAYGWRQEAVAANAQAISALGRELYERLGTLTGHWAKLGRQLHGAVSAYNQATSSLESRVLVTARRFPELGATSSDRELTEPEPVDMQVRELRPAIRRGSSPDAPGHWSGPEEG